jgi:phospholipase C
MRISALTPSAMLISALLFCAAVVPIAANAQGSLPVFKHAVVIAQENRTPDNLFGSGPARTPCNAEDPFEPGVDIENCAMTTPAKPCT